MTRATSREACILWLMPFDETRAATAEHVIPRALWNDDYVADGVCAACNQFMAHSFEGKFNRGVRIVSSRGTTPASRRSWWAARNTRSQRSTPSPWAEPFRARKGATKSASTG